MRAHVAQGDQAAALQHAKVYEALLAAGADLPPDREVIAFAEELRRVARSDPGPSGRFRQPRPALLRNPIHQPNS
jgi:hypothetical protein